MTQPTTLKWLRRLWTPLFLLASFAFLYPHAESLASSLVSVRLQEPWHVLSAIVAQTLSWTLLALGWQALLAIRLGRSIPTTFALGHLALLSLGKYIPGKLWGMIARGSRLGRIGIQAGEAVDATALEQVLVLHSAAIISAIFLLAAIPGPWSLLLSLLAVASILFAPLAVGIALSALSRLASYMRAGAGNSPRLAMGTRDYATLLGRYSLAWLAHGLALVAILASLRGEIPDLPTCGLLVFANTAAMVVGFAAIFAPAGLGVRETTLAGLLSLQLGMEDAIILSIAMRLWTVLTDLGLGGISLYLGRIRGNREGSNA